MTIAYHSQNRKELVKAISEIIGIPAVYQFMPTCDKQWSCEKLLSFGVFAFAMTHINSVSHR